MLTLVTFAVPEEAGPFRKLRLPDVRVCVTGMGAEAAERGIRRQLEAGHPDRVITCGFCGALNPEIERSTLLVGADSDPLFAAATDGIAQGRFHCAERVMVTAQEKQNLRGQTSCDAVEMESGVIRKVCAEAGIPALTLRVVSDVASEDLPLDFNRLMTAKGGIHFGRLAMEVARRPRMIPKLMALQKQSKAAANVLADGLKRVLSKLR